MKANNINNTIWAIFVTNAGKITKKMASEINRKYPMTAYSGKYFWFYELDPAKRAEKTAFVISVFEKYEKKGEALNITDKQFGMVKSLRDSEGYTGFNGFSNLGLGIYPIRDKKYSQWVYVPITSIQKQKIIKF